MEEDEEAVRVVELLARFGTINISEEQNPWPGIVIDFRENSSRCPSLIGKINLLFKGEGDEYSKYREFADRCVQNCIDIHYYRSVYCVILLTV